MSIEIYEGSILDVEADCIVNPANSFLNHGGGLAAVIARAARDYGKSIVPVTQPHGLHTIAEEERIKDLRAEWDAEQRNHPLIPTGAAGWTSAGALPYKGIVHAVGPIWGDGVFCERTLLASAHLEACSVAHDHKCRSIVFPAISCGIFGFPVDQAASAAVYALSFFWTRYMKITFALFEDEHVRAYRAALDSARPRLYQRP